MKRCIIISKSILSLNIFIISLLFLSTAVLAAGKWKPSAGLLSDVPAKQVMVQVEKQSNTAIILNYAVPAISFTPVAYQSNREMSAARCAMGNANLFSEPGKPEVPYIYSRVIMPYGRTVESIRVIAKEVVELPASYLLSYGEIQHPIGSETVVWSKPDAAIYGSDAAFPGKTHELTAIQYRFGIPIVYINLYPVSYVPKSGKVSYLKSFTVEITLKQGLNGGTDVKTRPGRILKSKITEENPEALSTYPATKDNAPDYRYLVIAPNSLINATETPKIADLVAQRESQGFTCKVEPLENIGTTTTAIRDFIKGYYTNNNTEFVLLVGDPGPTAIIPCFMVGSEASDMPYQCLDQATWSADYEAEVFIGRISAENGKEVSNQIYKILAYENTSGAYLTTGLSLGEKLDESTYGKEAMLQLESCFDESWTFEGLFDKDATWNKTELITLINSNKFSLINHLGHSNATYNLKMSNGDETKFTNTSFIFGKSQGCIPGKFQVDCIAERFTTQNRMGFFAGVWNSNYGYYQPGSPTGGSSQKVHYSFWKACWEQNMQYFGEFNEYSHRMNTSQKKDIVESNLFGCPAIKFRGKNLEPFIKVTVPNGGELFELGTACDIKWGDNIDGNVKIEIFKGGVLKEVLASTTPSDGSHIWQIPGNYQAGADYKIKITSIDSTALFDESDKNFQIISEYFIVPPYVQTFDTLDTGKTILPTKWEQIATDDFDWLVWKYKTPTKVPDQGAATGPDADHTSGSGNYIYVESSSSPFNGNPSKKVDFVTPKFKLNVLSNPQLSFWYHIFSNNSGTDEMGDLYLDICVDGTWKNDVFHVSKNQGDQWIVKNIDLNPYKGEMVIFRFRAVTGSGWASDICIDDFRIDGTVPINSGITAVPLSYDLRYYNSQIHFQVPENVSAKTVSLSLYNIQGKLIRTLVNDKIKSGFYSLPLRNMAAGLYLVRMEAKGFKSTINVVVQK